jgi:ABC-type antimicrobial peptide transport system ATPase subunit
MRCRYAADADAFMKKLRDQVSRKEEGEIVAKGEQLDSDLEPVRSLFERVKSSHSARNREEAPKVGPFDIDPVNTRESFKRIRP